MGSIPTPCAFGTLTQLVEYRSEKPSVTGSIPVGATLPDRLLRRSTGLVNQSEWVRIPHQALSTGCSQAVWRLLWEQKIVGSIPTIQTFGVVANIGLAADF